MEGQEVRVIAGEYPQSEGRPVGGARLSHRQGERRERGERGGYENQMPHRGDSAERACSHRAPLSVLWK
jgi:hypothetical protein